MDTQKEQNKMGRLWHRIIAPPAFIKDELERRGARLLNGLLVGLSLIGVGVEGLTLLLYTLTGEIAGYTGYRYTAMAISLMAVVYWLNRTRGYRWALPMLQLVITATIFAAAFADDAHNTALLFYLLIPLMLTIVYNSVRAIFLLAALFSVAVPVAASVFAPAALEVVLLDVVPTLLVCSALLMVLNQHRSSYEQERRREIEERERLFRSIFEQSVDAIFLVKPDGSGMRTNARAQELLGYSAEEMERLGPVGLTVPYERDDSRNKLEWVVETGLLAVYERTMLTKDGRELPTEMHVTTVKDAEGRTVLVQAVARDIRERKERQAQVERLTMGVN
jgi:PAS domain S-box-containing protein